MHRQERWFFALAMATGVTVICGGLLAADPFLVGVGIMLFVIGAVLDQPLTPRHP